jgi:hypothetical protein
MTLWADGTVYVIQLNSTHLFQGTGVNAGKRNCVHSLLVIPSYSYFLSAMGGSFSELGANAAAGLIICIEDDHCSDDSDSWIPILSSHGESHRLTLKYTTNIIFANVKVLLA